jgi:riboflavin kinase/FMN adenylyltransferase
MEIFDGHRALFRPLFNPAVAIGNFDGVHRGHQRLLAQTVAAAQRLGGDAVVLTFDPHPARVLAPDRAPPALSTRARKLELFAELGISACVVEPFTPELSRLEPEQFLRSILVDVLGARHVVVGYDFVFGHDRSGNTDTLQRFAQSHGFEVEIIAPVAVEQVVASSSRVRSLLGEGLVREAAALLGRDYDVDGTVVHGDGRGASIGVPTANIDGIQCMLPAHGVYAVRLQVLDGAPTDQIRALPGVANLGRKPTFGADHGLSLEVHVLDFSGDLYGRTVRVGFVERLRGEHRFAGVDALVAQIHADIEQARALFSPESAY